MGNTSILAAIIKCEVPMSIHCAICFRDDSGSYYKNAYVTLLSLFENTTHPVVVHVLHDETIVHGEQALRELCQRYGQAVLFHAVPSLDEETTKAITERYSIGATYRYYIHELVDADEAIYLDCDIIVNRDIHDLSSIKLDNHLVAAVLDAHSYWKKGAPRPKYARMVEYHGLLPESYINTGVMLLNLKKLRETFGAENIFITKTLASVRDNIPCYYPDMEIINSVLAAVPGSVMLLNERFNLWHNALHYGLEELGDTFFHFVIKPDSAFYPAHLLFWKYYAKAPFADDMFDRMAKAYASPAMNFVQAYCANARHRNHAIALLKYGAWGALVQTIKRKLRR